MRQTELLQALTALKPGEQIKFKCPEIQQAANGSRRSILFDGEARHPDVLEFIGQVEDNWWFTVFYDPIDYSFTFRNKKRLEQDEQAL